ncbi:MAG: hypothetical protein QF685_10230 [Verrucomicrobiota bacterium]|jgi:hypothetical protein|nr:hypothetical protein [Verrucomicrobiota bacterium]
MKSKTASFAVDSLIVLAIVVVFVWFRFAREERNANVMRSVNNASSIVKCLHGDFGYGGLIDSSKWTDTALKEAGTPKIFVSPQIGNHGTAADKTCHYALNAGHENSTQGILIFECDLGWNGVGGLADALAYMEKHKLHKIPVALSNGSTISYSAAGLQALDWGSPPKPKQEKAKPTPVDNKKPAKAENNGSGNSTAPQ